MSRADGGRRGGETSSYSWRACHPSAIRPPAGVSSVDLRLPPETSELHLQNLIQIGVRHPSSLRLRFYILVEGPYQQDRYGDCVGGHNNRKGPGMLSGEVVHQRTLNSHSPHRLPFHLKPALYGSIGRLIPGNLMLPCR